MFTKFHMNNLYSKLRNIYIYTKFSDYNYSGYIRVDFSQSNGQWSWRVCSVWSGCSKRFSQTLHFLFFCDLSLRSSKRTSLSRHSPNSGIEKDDAFSTSTISLFQRFVFELKNHGWRFLLFLFFFDSLSCLVSSFFYILPFGCQNDRSRERC